jgi:hypothetical protein
MSRSVAALVALYLLSRNRTLSVLPLPNIYVTYFVLTLVFLGWKPKLVLDKIRQQFASIYYSSSGLK